MTNSTSEISFIPAQPIPHPERNPSRLHQQTMPPPPPTLLDELLEEVFLRLPPDQPECLVRASLASKLWLGRLTHPRFHARYSEHHGAPPMLGFFQSGPHFVSEKLFVSTTKFRVCTPDPGNRGYSPYEVWDCRHGRALLGRRDVSPEKLVVLNPITGCRTELDAPEYYNCHGAAVLCSVNACDHRRVCHDGPFRVVFIGLDIDDNGLFVYASESLPEMGEWSTPDPHLPQRSKPGSSLHLESYTYIHPMPPVLVQDTLYFMLGYDYHHVGILRYDLCSKCISLIEAPLAHEDIAHTTILMGLEDGSLGFAHMDGLTLNLWSRQMGSNGVGSWSECKVIDLKEILPIPNKKRRLIGSVEGSDIIFVTMELGIYEINLKSLECKKIWNKETLRTLMPYMRFYCPQERANPGDAAH